MSIFQTDTNNVQSTTIATLLAYPIQDVSATGPEKRRKRHCFTKEERKILEEMFARTPYPAIEVIKKLAMQLNIADATVKNWFQNKRVKWKKTLKTTTTLQSEIGGHILSSFCDGGARSEDSDQQSQKPCPSESAGYAMQQSSSELNPDCLNPGAVTAVTRMSGKKCKQPAVQRDGAFAWNARQSAPSMESDPSEYQQQRTFAYASTCSSKNFPGTTVSVNSQVCDYISTEDATQFGYPLEPSYRNFILTDFHGSDITENKISEARSCCSPDWDSLRSGGAISCYTNDEDSKILSAVIEQAVGSTCEQGTKEISSTATNAIPHHSQGNNDSTLESHTCCSLATRCTAHEHTHQSSYSQVPSDKSRSVTYCDHLEKYQPQATSTSNKSLELEDQVTKESAHLDQDFEQMNRDCGNSQQKNNLKTGEGDNSVTYLQDSYCAGDVNVFCVDRRFIADKNVCSGQGEDIRGSTECIDGLNNGQKDVGSDKNALKKEQMIKLQSVADDWLTDSVTDGKEYFSQRIDCSNTSIIPKGNFFQRRNVDGNFIENIENQFQRGSDKDIDRNVYENIDPQFQRRDVKDMERGITQNIDYFLQNRGQVTEEIENSLPQGGHVIEECGNMLQGRGQMTADNSISLPWRSCSTHGSENLLQSRNAVNNMAEDVCCRSDRDIQTGNVNPRNFPQNDFHTVNNSLYPFINANFMDAFPQMFHQNQMNSSVNVLCRSGQFLWTSYLLHVNNKLILPNMCKSSEVAQNILPAAGSFSSRNQQTHSSSYLPQAASVLHKEAYLVDSASSGSQQQTVVGNSLPLVQPVTCNVYDALPIVQQANFGIRNILPRATSGVYNSSSSRMLQSTINVCKEYNILSMVQYPDSSFYSTSPMVQQATSSVYNTSPIVQQATSSVCNTLPSVQQTTCSVYNSLPQVQQATSSVCNTSPSVQQTVSNAYNILPQVQQVTSSVCNTSPSMQQTVSNVYNILPQVQQVTSSVCNTSPSMQQTVSNVYNILPQVQQVTSSVCNTSPIVQLANSNIYSTTTYVNPITSIVCNTLPLVHQTTSSAYNSSPIVQQATASAYNSSPIVQQATASAYNSSPIVQQATSSAYSTSPIVQQATPSAYNISPIVQQATSSAYSTSPIVQQVTSSAYNTSPIVQQATSSAYNTSPIVQQATSSAYNTSPIVQQATSSAYNTSPIVQQATSSAYNTSPIVQQATSSAYNTSPTVQQATSSAYNTSPTVQHATANVYSTTTNVHQTTSSVCTTSSSFMRQQTFPNITLPIIQQVTEYSDSSPIMQQAASVVCNIYSRLQQTSSIVFSVSPTLQQAITNTYSVSPTLQQAFPKVFTTLTRGQHTSPLTNTSCMLQPASEMCSSCPSLCQRNITNSKEQQSTSAGYYSSSTLEQSTSHFSSEENPGLVNVIIQPAVSSPNCNVFSSTQMQYGGSTVTHSKGYSSSQCGYEIPKRMPSSQPKSTSYTTKLPSFSSTFFAGAKCKTSTTSTKSSPSKPSIVKLSTLKKSDLQSTGQLAENLSCERNTLSPCITPPSFDFFKDYISTAVPVDSPCKGTNFLLSENDDINGQDFRYCSHYCHRPVLDSHLRTHNVITAEKDDETDDEDADDRRSSDT